MNDLYTRYNRQMILPDFGESAQNKLKNAKVLVVGAGGLGSPVLQFLTSAGIGTLGIADFDRVQLSNLQRQVLFNEDDLGKLKTEVSYEKLKKMNSEINIKIYSEKINNKNILAIIDNFDIVVDCTDNFPVRYLLNDICYIKNKPLIYGAIFQYEGQVSVFNIRKSGINYRDLFPIPPAVNEVPTCNQSGVLGTLSGIIGTLQANEVIKLITGIGEIASNYLLIFNILHNSFHHFNYNKKRKNIEQKKSLTIEDFISYNYEDFCNSSEELHNKTINKGQLQRELKKEKSVLIDVRNVDEYPKITNFPYLSIPFDKLENNLIQLAEYDSIIFVCQSGNRSKKALLLTKEKYPEKKIIHIENGIKNII